MTYETERKVYSLIKKYQRENFRTPTIRWLADKMGFRSTRSAKKYIDRLAESGKVVKDVTGKICFVTPAGLPILSTISAGIATEEIQDLAADTVELESYLCGDDEENLFGLKVRGDSMVDAGIHEDDLVIVNRKKEPTVGDIVVGIIDGGWSLKRLEKKDGKFYLKPENSKYDEMIPMESLEIGGVVVGSIRKY